MAIQQVLMDNDDPALYQRIFQPDGKLRGLHQEQEKRGVHGGTSSSHYSEVLSSLPGPFRVGASSENLDER